MRSRVGAYAEQRMSGTCHQATADLERNASLRTFSQLLACACEQQKMPFLGPTD